MKILALSDEISPVIHSLNLKARHGDVDLIISCGDLSAEYLEFVVSMLDVPLIYVPGNHDGDRFKVRGGIGLDGRVTSINKFHVVGIGGSRRYKARGRHQYSEGQMALRVLWLMLRTSLRRLFKGRGCDILITHSPPFRIHDAEDLAHVGFKSMHWFVQFARPRLYLHGHTHRRQNIDPYDTTLKSTRIINVHPYQIIQLDKDD